MESIEQMIKRLCPKGVEYVKLGEVGKFYGGLSGKSKNDFVDGNAKFITYMNVYSNPSLCVDVEEKVVIKEGERQNTIQYGDILFTGSSETPDECGMSSVLTTHVEEDLYLNSFCFGYRFDDLTDINPHFLKHLFRSASLRKAIAKTANGVTRFNVSKKLFAEIEIPLPPLEIQSRIVEVLDKMTTLTAELTAELEARKQQYEYYRNKLLSFNEIGEGNRQVTWKKISEIGQICMCKRIMKDQNHKQGEIPFYKIGTFGGTADAYISRELFEDYRARFKFPKKGDLLISAAGTIGKTVVFDGKDSYFQDSNIVWVDNDETIVTNRYLYHIYKIINWKTDGGTIRRLYNDNLRNTIIPVPSMEEQSRIVSILDRFETLTTDLQSGLPAEIEARRQQYEYYRNKLLTFEAV
ncbi:MAG: restriction endonuclease subunit S [Prevotella sp.]|nr:restriction endonuclease subunit S [Prevotella sp.]